jgi:hypothetical protein
VVQQYFNELLKLLKMRLILSDEMLRTRIKTKRSRRGAMDL